MGLFEIKEQRMQPNIAALVVQIVELNRADRKLLAKQLVQDFPELADQLSIMMHAEFSWKFLRANHQVEVQAY